ncbi:SDR family NAD(P)-dependent oxidoreductase [Yinghuangia seranimata]|uniref:SDR family NAD(P)-dependent oxidoreductase n=1 Tax=Yinghuangia seranimata TaxID=408067 RepID=UPI00248B9AFA|nr:SDR family NAD(P)-dependent oxidoreductase [Yinghuangia seranimata]MDI2127754.1 SDR family NAD(P)-dependent oxidoreductase [Yinghuangia seranimata]
MFDITGKTVLITGANRGIGTGLVDEALRRGAARVYAGTRGAFTHPDERVVPVTLDVTDPAHVDAAAEAITELDVLVNNAGIALYDDLTDADVLEQHLAVNLFGVHRVTRAFLPHLTRAGGALVNNISLSAVAPLPIVPSYSVSKAAALSLTQSLRMLLAAQGVSVHAVLTGPTDTDMNRDFDIPKATVESVARAVFDGVEKGDEDIFPDPVSGGIADAWGNGPTKALEREFAGMVAAEAAS